MIASCLRCHGQFAEDPVLGPHCIQCGRPLEPPRMAQPKHSSGVRLAVAEVPPEHRPVRNSRGKLSPFQIDVLRHLKGKISQYDAAEVFGIAQPYVSQIQGGERRTLGERFQRAVEQVKGGGE